MKIQLPLCPSFTHIIGTSSALKSNLKITPVLSPVPKVLKIGIWAATLQGARILTSEIYIWCTELQNPF